MPPTEQVHLHHGTWLSVPDYGMGPFFAAGEEKTIAPFPKGYGMPVKATDQWLLLYMVHSAVQQPMELYITYDVDFVPEADAKEIGMQARVSDLDSTCARRPTRSSTSSARTAARTASAPGRRRSAPPSTPGASSSSARASRATARARTSSCPQEGEPLGAIDSFTGGTLIGIGGHLHPGGLQNEIDLVRNGKAKRIYTGRAAYWERKKPEKPGGPPTSWDFSMRVSGYPYWGVRVKPGDALRSNVTYDTTIQSTYENMGIAVALLAPDTPDGKPTARGVNPFKAPRDRSKRCKSGGLTAKRPTLCDQGLPSPTATCPRTTTTAARATRGRRPRGAPTEHVTIANFLYAPGDLTTIEMTGVPTVKLGDTLDFTNVDGAVDLPHGHLVRASRAAGHRRLVPARRRRDQHRPPGRLRLLRARDRRARDRPRQADARLGPAGDRARRASSPARSSPTSAASTPGCAARSRSPSDQLEATTGRRRARARPGSAGPTCRRTCRST